MIALDGNLQDLAAMLNESESPNPPVIIMDMLPQLDDPLVAIINLLSQLDDQELRHLQMIEIPAAMRAERKNVTV